MFLAGEKSGQWKIKRLVITSLHRTCISRYCPSPVLSNDTWGIHTCLRRTKLLCCSPRLPTSRSGLSPRAFSLAKRSLRKGSNRLERKNITNQFAGCHETAGQTQPAPSRPSTPVKLSIHPSDPTPPPDPDSINFSPSLPPPATRRQAGIITAQIFQNRHPKQLCALPPSLPTNPPSTPNNIPQLTRPRQNSPNRASAASRNTPNSPATNAPVLPLSNLYTAEYKQWPAERESPRAERARAARRGRARAPRSSRATRRGPVSR